MIKLLVQLTAQGDSYEEKCIINYHGQTIYDGYVDDLVTSVNGYLEVRLNYGTQSKLSTRIKKLGNMILWVPLNMANVELVKKYKTIVLSYSDMDELWDKLGYTLEDDLPLINNATSEDLKLIWLINSHLEFSSNDIKEDVKQLSNSIIAYSHEESEFLKKAFDNLIKASWIDLEFNSLKQINSEQDKLVVYLDDSNNTIEWSALLADDRKNIFINMGNQWCLPLNLYSNHFLNSKAKPSK